MELVELMEPSLMQANSSATNSTSTFTTIPSLIQQFHLWYVF